MTQNRKLPHPPRLAERLLRLMFPGNGDHTSTGDFTEAFYEMVEEHGIFAARLWYWMQIVISFKALVWGKIYWSIVMIKSYIKIAFRNFKRQKGYTLINMFGLTAGIAACLVIFLFVNHELSYDKYHQNLDRIFRVASFSEAAHASDGAATTSGPVAQVLRDYFPEAEVVARLFIIPGGLMERGEVKYFEDTRIFADNEIFEILTIPFLQGNSKTALTRPYTIVISDRMAKKYFGDGEPLGQIFKINNRDYEVTGVAVDPPDNTHFKYDCLVSMKTLEGRYPFDRWFLSNLLTYLKVKTGINLSSLKERVAAIADTYAPKELMQPGETYTYALQPGGDIHLFSHLRGETEPGLNPLYLYIFSAIGIFVLLIACINFINLSTARSSQRAREVGVRKVIGARRGQLVRQFYGESTVIILTALVTALALVGSLLPSLNMLMGKSFTAADLFQPRMILFLVLLIGFVGFAASGYPALLLSAFQPSKVLKSDLPGGSRGSGLRKILVVGQFAISIALIAGTLIIFRQIHYMKTRPLGFDPEQKLILPVRGMIDIEKNYETVKAAFLQHPNITGASVSSNIPGERLDRWDTQTVSGGDEMSRVLNHLYIGTDFLNNYGIRLLTGRDFNREMSTDVLQTFILNRSGAAAYGWTPEEAIGKKLQSITEPSVVIGVTEDFHYQGLQTKIEPLGMVWRPDYLRRITLNVRTENLPETLAAVKSRWDELFPGNPFDYYFLDSSFEQQYRSEQKVSRMFSAFTVLGVLIACLGLLGLASFTAEQKTKEIGIRKIMGATSREIMLLLTREFVKWVVFANLLAWPAIYLIMNRWLENFAYRIPIGIEVLLASAGIALLIALLTVSRQSLKAAAADPVTALKYE